MKVSESTVHGKGVFAISEILQGEAICFFDGELKDCNTTVKMKRLPEGALSIVDSEHVFENNIRKGK